MDDNKREMGILQGLQVKVEDRKHKERVGDVLAKLKIYTTIKEIQRW